MLKKTWLAVIVVVLFLFIGIVLFTQPGRGLQHEVSATFRGWGVNGFSPEKSAIMLAVTNPTPAAVNLSVYAVERQMQGDWKSDEPALMGATLEPGEAFTFAIPVATSNAVWRIRLHCQERAAGLDGVVDRAKEMWEKITGKTIHYRYNGRVYYVTNVIQ